MSPDPAPRLVVVHPDADLLARAAGARFLLTLLDAQSVTTPVHVVLTGGTSGTAMLRAAGTDPLRTAVDWTGVHVWWGDERFAPTGDPERNETHARSALLNAVPLPAENIHVVPGPDAVASPEEAAAAYSAELRAHAADGAEVPDFAVVLLGVGPDAHVASLFPGKASLGVTALGALAERDSPKPPPLRVSLTLPTLCSARQVWLLAAGEGKAEAVAASLGGAPVEEAPAGAVHGRQLTLWLVDAAAAGVAAS
ncbi:6-phosphogluconolactonase [Georgenia faecalis]|uniref:6-phosphogluconolactonase n=1 Tax=Georgenia faecalis TaxID=2483799 RepID=A0ABV9DC37_9MICO|nr:6-phosphogluconolactonase [Georgenia faecalis]